MPIWTGAVNNNWSNAGNWAADGTGSGVPTAASDAVFSSTSAVNCTVDVVGGAVCRNLNFNGGTGYVGTITMSNTITVGATSAGTPNHSVTLSAGMGINPAGTSGIITRANGTTTLTSNGRTWPNGLAINVLNVSVSVATIVGNWVVQGNLTIGNTGASMTLNGAFSITVQGNLTLQGAASNNAQIAGTAGSLTTIVIAGNSTWSNANPTFPVSIGFNININAPGNTVTIANGASFGGLGVVAGTTLSYTAGTVITQGSFNLMFQSGSGTTYTVNVNGDPSASATATSSTGVNFNNLNIRTLAIGAVQACALSSPICVVGNTTVVSVSTAKGSFLINSSTAYLNGNLTVNGYGNGTSIFQLQGTGTWSENNTLTTASTNFGISNPVVINTLGTITLTSFVGIRTGSITYTAGTFTTTGFGLRVAASSITGFGSGNVFVDTLYHTSTGSLASAASAITINDSGAGTPKPQLSIGTLTFDGFGSTNTHRFAGTAGWKCNNFLYQSPSGIVNSLTLGLIGTADHLYTVNSSFIATVFNPSFAMSLARNPVGTPSVNFVLTPGASQDVYYVGASQVNSSAGQTIWTRKGTLSNAVNWNLWTYPKTRFSSSIG